MRTVRSNDELHHVC